MIKRMTLKKVRNMTKAVKRRPNQDDIDDEDEVRFRSVTMK